MLLETLDSQIQYARKNSEKTLLKVLQLIKSELTKTSKNPTEEQEAKILLKMSQAWKEEYNNLLVAGRDVSVISEEIDTLMKFVPELPSTTEIQGYTEGVFDVYKANNPNISMKDLKPIMDLVKQKYPLADGSIIAKTFKELLNGK